MSALRKVFFISDHTGVTAEKIGSALLNQFGHFEFDCTTIPFIDTPKRAEEVLNRIQLSLSRETHPPLIISSILNPTIRAIFEICPGLVYFDVLSPFIEKLEKTLKTPASIAVGRTHGMVSEQDYDARIAAVNYALENDDGITSKNYSEADLILIGVSRTGKTPTCLYLAMQYGIKAANYPLTHDDFDRKTLPELFKTHTSKLFGLTIDAQRLHHIRQARFAQSLYADLRNCRFELSRIESLYRRFQIPYLNTTHQSIEELAAAILHISKIKRRC